MPTATATRGMSQEHKDALAAGRKNGRIVKAYLAALKANKPKRGRKRTPESINARLGKIATALLTTDPLKEVLLLQEQRDLEKELSAMADDVNLLTLEADFIGVAGDYSRSKGIDYAIWRRVGVSAETLAKAGIKRA